MTEIVAIIEVDLYTTVFLYNGKPFIKAPEGLMPAKTDFADEKIWLANSSEIIPISDTDGVPGSTKVTVTHTGIICAKRNF